MDQKINAFLDSLVADVLNSPALANLPPEQKNAMAEKISSRLDEVVFDAIIDHLSMEQLNEIKDLPMDNPQFLSKIEEFAAFIPDLAKELEAKLSLESANLKQNPQILSQL